jgi:hypothetical protein
VTASVDKTSTKVDEALTYRVRISGSGNLRTLPDPVLNFPVDFEVYPPQVSQSTDRSGGRVTGTKTYEYVLIPRGPGTRVIPAVSYSYFDPSANRYASARADSLPVAVTGTATTSGPVAMGRDRGTVVAQQRLAKARTLVAPDRAKEFHAEVGRALQGFLGDKLNVAEAGLVRDAIVERLSARHVPDEVVREYFGSLDACDRYRFAPADVTGDDMRALLDRAERAMGNLDQALRR